MFPRDVFDIKVLFLHNKNSHGNYKIRDLGRHRDFEVVSLVIFLSWLSKKTSKQKENKRKRSVVFCCDKIFQDFEYLSLLRKTLIVGRVFEGKF